MSALFFGESEQPLYGFFHPADFSSDKRVGLLICNGLSHEYLRTHRMLKQLAVQLSRAGISVMRFDYPGTGDSWGSQADASIDNWAASIPTALEELEALAAADRLAILSLRAGTLVCSKADLQGLNVSHHFSLDPVTDGAAYCAELDQAQIAMLNDPLRFRDPLLYRNDRHTEWLGNEYSAEFVRQLKLLRLDAPDLGSRYHLIHTRPFEKTAGVKARNYLDVDCRWMDATALEMQVVLPGLSAIIAESL
jgi:pimeloyl-ACP methyl ester carboxylesterase